MSGHAPSELQLSRRVLIRFRFRKRERGEIRERFGRQVAQLQRMAVQVAQAQYGYRFTAFTDGFFLASAASARSAKPNDSAIASPIRLSTATASCGSSWRTSCR